MQNNNKIVEVKQNRKKMPNGNDFGCCSHSTISTVCHSDRPKRKKKHIIKKIDPIAEDRKC